MALTPRPLPETPPLELVPDHLVSDHGPHRPGERLVPGASPSLSLAQLAWLGNPDCFILGLSLKSSLLCPSHPKRKVSTSHTFPGPPSNG